MDTESVGGRVGRRGGGAVWGRGVRQTKGTGGGGGGEAGDLCLLCMGVNSRGLGTILSGEKKKEHGGTWMDVRRD